VLRIDHGRRLQQLHGRPRVVETIATAAGDDRPGRCGFQRIRDYSSPAYGAMTLWARSSTPNTETDNR
jgi:hypothetical protein